jgi:predicted tellurium resistance membrane protein TerC
MFFPFFDLTSFFLLFFLELFLSFDNGIIFSLLLKEASAKNRKKLLYLGLFFSFLSRFFLLFFLSKLFLLPLFSLLSNFYLLFFSCYSLWNIHKEKGKRKKAPKSLFITFLWIEGSDLLFTLDSLAAGFTILSSRYSNPEEKIWIMYLAGVFGLMILRFSAQILARATEKIKWIEMVCYAGIGLLGMKNIFSFFCTKEISYFLLFFLFFFFFLREKRKNS